jgi:hypothetical protein
VQLGTAQPSDEPLCCCSWPKTMRQIVCMS